MASLTTDKPVNCRDIALKCLNDLPPFSPTLNRLLATLAQEDVPFSKVGDLIEKDTVVSGNVLHLVNSALYGRRGTINSVRHAVSLLGINKLRNAVLGMSITRMWNEVRTPLLFSMGRFNKHAAATAILADLLAQRIQVEYPEGAFVAGLLHDVGRLLIAIALGDQHEKILKLRESGMPLMECEQEILGVTHPELSAAAMQFWNLPAPIQAAVRYHHDSALDPARAPGVVTLSQIVEAANRYVNAIGVSIFPESAFEEEPGAAFAGLGFGETERLIEDFKTEFEAVAQFFG
ncbi:MAG: HDOD domain-containing protein [Bryobacteraceae bacterium]